MPVDQNDPQQAGGSEMLEKIRIQEGDIEIGQPLPWPIFDADDVLLLQEGTVVSKQRQLEMLLERGLYRGPTTEEIEEHEQALKAARRPKEPDPFQMESICTQSLADLLASIVEGQAVDVMGCVDKIIKEIRWNCERNANATLAAVHLARGMSYSEQHPLHTAILCQFILGRLDISEAEQDVVLAAALTMNVGMYALQQTLHGQAEALTQEQRQQVEQHPLASVELLQQAGISDQDWLRIVAEHHERIDGQGYPRGLSGEQIHRGAKIIATADTYAALVTARNYRKPIHSQSALKKLFISRGNGIDEFMAEVLISEVGIHTPGSVVKLSNGETGIVVRRAFKHNGKAVDPQVAVLISPRGGYYDKPFIRDNTDETYKIAGIGDSDDIRMPSNLGSLWGLGANSMSA